MRIDFVSPLPPVRSGIADYSADLLPHLAAGCDLRLVRLPELPLDDELARRYPVVAAGRTGEDGRLPWYQMGNNQHHLAVYDLALARPGVVTLHDLVLHHFQIERTLKPGDFEGYRAQLAADHGWIGEAAARPRRWPGGDGNAAKFALPAHRTLLGRQRGVLTHSAWAAEALREEIGGLAVAEVPMGVPLGAPAAAEDGRAFRRRHGVPEGVPLLGSFGFQTPMKRTAQVMDALAELPGVHLIVAGEVAAASCVEAAIERAGVGGRVHLLGFLPFAELEAAIAAVDVCLNLRYPSAGETSASLLRVLAVGRPVVVSDYAQLAGLDVPGVIAVPVGEGERRALVERLTALLASRDDLDRLGREAREHVRRRHDPAAAAIAMLAACRDFEKRAPRDPGPPRVPRPTSATARSFAGALDVRGAEAPWPAGSRRSLKVRLENRSRCRWLAGERPEGGVALDVRLLRGDRDLFAGRPWPGLPRDLDPGDAWDFRLDVRRPAGPARLVIEPHAFGVGGFGAFGGPRWEQGL